MTPGTMMRTRANILMKVKVIWVREAIVTLQQFTATTKAATEKRSGAACQLWSYDTQNPLMSLESLTHSEDADQPDQRHGRSARHEERLHHVLAEGQAHVRSHSWPAETERQDCSKKKNNPKFDPVRRRGHGDKWPDEEKFNPEAQKCRHRSQCLQQVCVVAPRFGETGSQFGVAQGSWWKSSTVRSDAIVCCSVVLQNNWRVIF